MSKDFKIWGVSYGLVGDLIMSLPTLNYLEKKYPNSYKYWVIQKKCSQCLNLFINHPLIDRIKITDNWEDYGEEDKQIIKNCDVVIPFDQRHENDRWYNTYGCVEETARLAGFHDIKEILNKEEMTPKLEKWFNVGFDNSLNTGYSKIYHKTTDNLDCISIWPFAGYGEISSRRSPSKDWWIKTVKKLTDENYRVFHFGFINEPELSDSDLYSNFTKMSFFDQIKISLSTKLAIGTDSGSMWVLGAYSFPAIHLMTYWMPGHNKNPMALEPANRNGISLFDHLDINNIPNDKILNILEDKK